MKALNPKSVRFADENDVVLFYVEEAFYPLWLAPEELLEMRNQAKKDAEYLKTKGYGILLKNGFDESDKLAQKHMSAFSRLPGRECPRGTEVYIFHQHRDQVDRNHSKVVKTVLNRQSLLCQKDSPSSDKLRSISRKHSRNSKLFARRMGLADQRAVKEGDDLWKAQGIIKELNMGNAKMVRRKASITDVKSMGSKVGGGVAQMVSLAYMTSQIAHKNYSPSSDQVPVAVLSSGRRAGKNTFSNVILDALDLLDDDLSDDFGASTAPTFMAKSA